MAHCERGDEYIVGQDAHTYKYEGGGAAVLGSIQPQPIDYEADGIAGPGQVEGAIKPDDPHFARTRLLCLENTRHGSALPLDYLKRAREFTRMPTPGPAPGRRARLQRRGASACRHGDQQAFRHRLGLPVEGPRRAGRLGAVRLERTDRRKRAAGARWSAAACARPACSPRRACYALEHNVARLAQDHENARALAQRPVRHRRRQGGAGARPTWCT